MGSEIQESFLIRVEIYRISILNKGVIINKNFLPFIRFCNDLLKLLIVIVVFPFLKLQVIFIKKSVLYLNHKNQMLYDTI